jgi:anti-sigma factor RsiW
MNDRQTFSDQDLTAYLDGVVDQDQKMEIESALTHDPALVDRLDRLSLDTGSISAAFTHLLSQSPEAPSFLDADAGEAPERRTSLRLTAAALLLGLFGGGLGGHLAAPTGEESWRDFVATYHALYINETLTHVATSEAESRAELARVAATIGKSIAPGVLSGVDGLIYKRAQTLGFEGRALAQLAFLSDTGEPFALCIMRSVSPELTRMTFETRRGMRAASWSANGYEYLLIGGSDDKLTRAAASYFATRL